MRVQICRVAMVQKSNLSLMTINARPSDLALLAWDFC